MSDDLDYLPTFEAPAPLVITEPDINEDEGEDDTDGHPDDYEGQPTGVADLVNHRTTDEPSPTGDIDLGLTDPGTLPTTKPSAPVIGDAVLTGDALAIALALTAPGLFKILPIRHHTKNPGSIVGEGWPNLASNDPDQIRQWFDIPEPPGIAIQVGDKYLVVDADDVTQLPEWAQEELSHAPQQRTGTNRTHYILRMPHSHAGTTTPTPGLDMARYAPSITSGPIRRFEGYDKSAGDKKAGHAAVIISAPTIHKEHDADSDRYYEWIQAGEIPIASRRLTAHLAHHGTSNRPHNGTHYPNATGDEVDAFAAAHPDKSPAKAAQLLTQFQDMFDHSDSTYDTLKTMVGLAVREIADGNVGADEALAPLLDRYVAWRTNPEYACNKQTHDEAERAFVAYLTYCVGQETGRRAAETAVAPTAAPDTGKPTTSTPTPAKIANNEKTTSTTQPTVSAPARANIMPTETEQKEFWESSDQLRHIRDYARSKLVGPWSTLGGVLVRRIGHVAPHVVLPALVSGVSTLNLNIGLVGKPSAGKGFAPGRRAFPELTHQPEEIGIGSGEGITHQYATRIKLDRSTFAYRRVRWSALFTSEEIDTLTALSERSASTISSQLRKAWSGESLGFGYVDKDKALPVPEHSYRACVLTGVQPNRAEPLLDESAGGLPQRFLYLPVNDPYAPDTITPVPEPLPTLPALPAGWELPTTGIAASVAPTTPATFTEIDIAAPIVAQIEADRRIALRDDSYDIRDDDLSAHRNLMRLRTAAALMILEGRTTITVDDWDRAQLVLAVSEATVSKVRAAITTKARHDNHAASVWAAERAAIMTDHAETTQLDKAAERIKAILAKPDHTDGMWKSELIRNLRRHRDHAEEALDALIDNSVVTAHERPAPRQRGGVGIWVALA
ncbi:bifunctional DNA primase/polymerase [Gordonia hongkongensis]|uniref:bifunctional DNA primase/polymerase n=1 Tax=Gordonia hongkongensis TaxID=1701090 RepID=UPI003D75AE79